MTDSIQSIAILIILALLATLVVAVVGPAIGEILQDLPYRDWTKHASESHVDETWNVSTILPLMAASACHPIIIHQCPPVEIEKIICPVPGSQIWVGLIMNLKTKRVITGFPAPLDYWQRAAVRDGCMTLAAP